MGQILARLEVPVGISREVVNNLVIVDQDLHSKFDYGVNEWRSAFAFTEGPDDGAFILEPVLALNQIVKF